MRESSAGEGAWSALPLGSTLPSLSLSSPSREASMSQWSMAILPAQPMQGLRGDCLVSTLAGGTGFFSTSVPPLRLPRGGADASGHWLCPLCGLFASCKPDSFSKAGLAAVHPWWLLSLPPASFPCSLSAWGSGTQVPRCPGPAAPFLLATLFSLASNGREAVLAPSPAG